MILKGSQCSGAARLSRHLMNERDNEHVELHDLRGFACEDDLMGALLEAEAIAKGTRCKQYLFSLSLNPPEDETVNIATYETAIEMIEQKLGLDGQTRPIVFHEKEGRRHAHAVWSRIDTESMTAIPLPFFKAKLMDVSKELYLEQGWNMPKGLIDQSLRNPLNCTRAEWQHAQRMKQDLRMIKAAFRECWARPDTSQAFAQALEERNRAARLPRGLGGLWSWITGRYGKIRRQNEVETLVAQRRDDEEDVLGLHPILLKVSSVRGQRTLSTIFSPRMSNDNIINY